MARTPSTLSRRAHAESKSRGNIGELTMRARKPKSHANESAGTHPRGLIDRSPSPFVGGLRLPILRSPRFHGGGLGDRRREGAIAEKRCSEMGLRVRNQWKAKSADGSLKRIRNTRKRLSNPHQTHDSALSPGAFTWQRPVYFKKYRSSLVDGSVRF
jgi:hypothetical protein